MSDQAFFGAGVLFLIPMGMAMWAIGRSRGGRLWTGSWLTLYASGAAAALTPQLPMMGHVFPLLGTLFPALLWSGSRRFVGARIPSWLPAATLVIGVTRGSIQPFFGEGVTQSLGAALIAAAALASAREFAKHPQGYARAMGPLLITFHAALAPTAFFYAYWRVHPELGVSGF